MLRLAVSLKDVRETRLVAATFLLFSPIGLVFWALGESRITCIWRCPQLEDEPSGTCQRPTIQGFGGWTP